MKAVAFFILSVALIQPCLSHKILFDFIRDYYEASNIHQIVVFACWDYAASLSRDIMGFNNFITYRSTTSDVDITTILRSAHFQIGVVLDFDCPRSENILDKFSTHLHFNNSYYWLVLSKLMPIPVKYLQHLKLTIETELTFAVRENDAFLLYDVYNPSYRHDCEVITKYKGQWTRENGLKDELTQYIYERRNLGGVTLNLTITFANVNFTAQTDIIRYLTSTKNKGLDPMQKSHYAIMMYLQYLYKFNFTVYRSAHWGYLVNGSYNGILGDLIRDDGVDMSISPFELIAERGGLVDHVVSTWFTDFTFTFLHPKQTNLRNNFLKPFTDDLWWAILVVGSIYWALLFLSLMLEHHHQAETHDIGEGVVETGMTAVAALSQQGLSDSPNFPSGRITFLSLFVWALLLYQFYSASIVSSLMTTPPRWIKTLKALVESDLTVGAIDVSHFREWLQASKNPDVSELYNRKMNSSVKYRPHAFLKVPSGLKKVQEGGYAFLTETASTYRIIRDTFTEEQICSVEEVRFQPRTMMSPLLPKNTPFHKMMTYGLTKVIQGGLLAYVRQYWRGKFPKCPESYSSMPTAMGMPQFSPALFLLCIGAAVSIVTLIIEYCYFHMENKTNGTQRDITKLPEPIDQINPED
ncbi:uncharacterized protein [Fopius arisanus]|uniref:Ionotropic receptor 75a N-terminal domain-containing protein n=1 Tax=Fopius arisanus TaxID=64838 RepID=A0A9R1ST49_9HYME|nr:PREDICTED: uncharacterized protein LOC105262661 [Fopius arisanus]